MKRRLLYFIAAVLTAGTAHGWESDVSKNTQITPTGLSYFENEVKTNKDGISYVFMLCPGDPVSMRLQIVDGNGERLLPRAGEVISHEPNNSWFGLNQYMELDSKGDVFIGVEDYRKHTAEKLFTYHIYKYTAAGTKTMDAVTLNDGTGYKLASGLSMCATDDGGLVCAFNGTDDKEDADYLVAEKISGEGKSLWKKVLKKNKGMSSAYPFLTDAGNNRVMVLIVQDGEIQANVIEADGSLAWQEYKTVFSGGLASPKVWEVLRVEELPGHKTMLSLVDGGFQGRLVVIDSDGTIGLDGSDKGVLINDNTMYASDMPSATYNSADGTYTCLYKMFDRQYPVNQLLAHKINSDGSKAWATPAEVTPLNEEFQYGYYTMRGTGDGRNAVFHMALNRNNYNDVKGYMQIIESDGSIPAAPIAFATSTANKQTLRVSELTGGQFITAWDEKRNGQMSLFMQNIKPEGSTAIGNIESNTDNAGGTKEYFSPDGMRLGAPRKGLNIVRTTGGKTVKVIK